MFQKPQRNASATARPVSRSGQVFSTVSVSAKRSPAAPATSAVNAGSGRAQDAARGRDDAADDDALLIPAGEIGDRLVERRVDDAVTFRDRGGGGPRDGGVEHSASRDPLEERARQQRVLPDAQPRCETVAATV